VLSWNVKKRRRWSARRLARACVLEVVGVDEGPTEAFDQLRRIAVRLQIDEADPLLKQDHRFIVVSGVVFGTPAPPLATLPPSRD
jgi:hypothetical protein